MCINVLFILNILANSYPISFLFFLEVLKEISLEFEIESEDPTFPLPIMVLEPIALKDTSKI
jgi:hypothetical protein